MKFTKWHRESPSRWTSLIFVILVAAAVSFALPNAPMLTHPVTSRPAQQSGPGDDPYAQPIYTADDALERSLAQLPDTFVPSETVVRLVDRMTIATQWTLETNQLNLPYFDWMPDAPLWIVGMEGPGLEVTDVALMPAGNTMDDTSPADGGFQIWDANYGALVTSGALMAGTNYTLVRLGALPNQALTVQHATEVPTPNIP